MEADAGVEGKSGRDRGVKERWDGEIGKRDKDRNGDGYVTSNCSKTRPIKEYRRLFYEEINAHFEGSYIGYRCGMLVVNFRLVLLEW
jgi:hypothetical protein